MVQGSLGFFFLEFDSYGRIEKMILSPYCGSLVTLFSEESGFGALLGRSRLSSCSGEYFQATTTGTLDINNKTHRRLPPPLPLPLLRRRLLPILQRLCFYTCVFIFPCIATITNIPAQVTASVQNHETRTGSRGEPARFS